MPKIGHVPAGIREIVAAKELLIARDLSKIAGISEVSAEEYLRRLRAEGTLARRAPGVFAIARKTPSPMRLNGVLSRVSAILGRHLPFTPVVGWTTEWFIPYGRNMPSRNWNVLETPPSATEAVADVLARYGSRALVNPSPEDVPAALRLFERPLIVWPHSEIRFTTKRGSLLLPTSERLLVDFYFSVTRRGLPYPETELASITMRFLSEHDVNLRSLASYAGRRSIRKEYSLFLNKNAGLLRPDIRAALATAS